MRPEYTPVRFLHLPGAYYCVRDWALVLVDHAVSWHVPSVSWRVPSARLAWPVRLACHYTVPLPVDGVCTVRYGDCRRPCVYTELGQHSLVEAAGRCHARRHLPLSDPAHGVHRISFVSQGCDPWPCVVFVGTGVWHPPQSTAQRSRMIEARRVPRLFLFSHVPSCRHFLPSKSYRYNFHHTTTYTVNIVPLC